MYRVRGTYSQLGGNWRRPPAHHWPPRAAPGEPQRLFVTRPPTAGSTWSSTPAFILRRVTPIHLVSHPTRRVRHPILGDAVFCDLDRQLLWITSRRVRCLDR
jgi:hypothetical protein